jgi:Putative  PD-(D/E)XK family member, (DUF4420)
VNQISEITKAWNVFRHQNSLKGWQVIPVTSLGRCKLLAAMGMPSLQEALFISFGDGILSHPHKLPDGKGFSLSISDNDGCTWLEIAKTKDGQSDLFVTMLENLLIFLANTYEVSDSELFRLFINRLQCWQEFMSKKRGLLTIESQTGLFGELCFLDSLIDTQLQASSVSSWVGPNRGVQDFKIGSGAIEIKSTLSEDGFIAKIGSLAQLDDSILSPIYLIGQKLKISSDGILLKDLVQRIREKIKGDVIAETMFEELLIYAGYLDMEAGYYDRKLKLIKSLVFLINSTFPRITSSVIHQNIRSVMYEIDISSLHYQELDLNKLLKQLGVSK